MAVKATIQIDQEIDLEEIIVKALRLDSRGFQSVHHIEILLNREYGDSLQYSKDDFYRALEHLVSNDFHLGNVSYHLNMKIYRNFGGDIKSNFGSLALL